MPGHYGTRFGRRHGLSQPSIFATLLVIVFAGKAWALQQAFLPIAFLSPENGLGAGGKYIVRSIDSAGAITPHWTRFDVHAYVTTRAQFEIKAHLRGRSRRSPFDGGGSGFGFEPRLTLEGFDTPYSYYGPGNEPPIKTREDALIYEPLGGKATFEGLFTHRFGDLGTKSQNAGHGIWRLRLVSSVQAVRMLEPGETWPPSRINAVLPASTPGYAGGWHDLHEGAVEYDSRDDEDLPTRGLHLGLRFGHSSPFADFDFGKGEVFAALYATPHRRIEWAGKVLQRSTFGPIPFYELPVLGDRKMLRGIPDRRLRDAHAQAVQTEWRYTFKLALPLVARAFGDTWQVAAFGECGRVSGETQSLWKEKWHPSAGLGGRLIVHHRLGALRGDVGFSEYGFGLYVDFNQAF